MNRGSKSGSVMLNQHRETFQALERALGGREVMLRMVEDLNRQRDITSAALAPFEQLQKSGQLAALANQSLDFQQLQFDLTDTLNRFRMPEFEQLSALLYTFEASRPPDMLAQFLEQEANLKHAMESMRTPWLDIADEMRSIHGFASLQGLGQALQTLPAFGEELSALLRSDLGDWREKIAWPQQIFDDPLARAAFYTQQGLDRGLTAFPAEAFHETLRISGLRGVLPDRAEEYDPDPEDDEQEAAFERTNAAHDRLQRFETQVRQFIDTQMTTVFGTQWTRRRLPNGMREEWIKKRNKARASGEAELPLIAYADFTDYLKIISRRDNWREVFSLFFTRETFIQESFQRLYPIRVTTMHARTVTQDDELYLYVETQRILAAIESQTN